MTNTNPPTDPANFCTNPSDVKKLKRGAEKNLVYEKAKLDMVMEEISLMSEVSNKERQVDQEWFDANLAYLQAKQNLLNISIQRSQRQIEFFNQQLEF